MNPQQRPPIRPRSRRQRGLSLVELMVALALGAFIVIGIIQLFSANQETYQVNVGQARLQESARFAVEFVGAPLRMAGFAGCYSETDIFMALAPVAGVLPYEANYPAGILVAYEATTDTTWFPALDGAGALPAEITDLGVQGGTDVLTVRLFDPIGARLSQAMASDTAPIVARLPAAQADYQTGTIMAISDCQKGAIFSSTNTAFAANTMTIQHTGGGANAVPNLTNDGTSFDVDATVHAIQSQTFFVAPGAGTNNRGLAPLSLWRSFGSDGPAELVEGVEDLQLLFGEDTDGDTVANRYATIQNLLTDTSQIVTIRFQVTVTSVDAIDPDVTAAQMDVDGDLVTDRGAPGLLRRTFTRTVALRNRIGD